MIICGIQKLSLLDYPGKIAATIFTGGCNFRCPFCHNASLVTGIANSSEIPENEILDFLGSRVGKLDGVCITGGEPLLQNDLSEFIRKIRDMGFLVKLDTNGALPEKLQPILDAGLIDYVAMDIKNSEAKYPLTIGVPDFDVSSVKKSVSVIMASGVDYEFRTTLVRGFHEETDMQGIGELISGAKVHYLQNFIDSGDLVGFKNDSEAVSMAGLEREELESFQSILSCYVQKSSLRGI